MIQIKRATLIFLLVFALIAGALGVCFYMGLDAASFRDGVVVVKSDEYKQLQEMKSKYGNLDSVINYVEKNYYSEIDEGAIQDELLHAVLEPLDKYSYYMNAEEFADFLLDSTGKYSGVGLTISFDDTGYIIVISPTDDTPAQRAGIRSGDYILAVDGVEYYGEDLDTAAHKMRGEAGTEVVLTVKRGDTITDYTLTRADIVLSSVKYEMHEDGIGYIRISQFLEDTAKEFKAALDAVEAEGATSLIIDLRDNGGGYVDVAVRIADYLMDDGIVVYAQNKKGERQNYYTFDGKDDIPLVVLVNGGTASASEILAAGFKDNARATLVGTQTFGKGIIQAVDTFKDGSAIKLTVEEYFSPNGTKIHEIGVAPDYYVEIRDEDYDEAGFLIADWQMLKAEELLKK